MTFIDFMKKYGRETELLNNLRQTGDGTATWPNRVAAGDTTQIRTVL